MLTDSSIFSVHGDQELRDSLHGDLAFSPDRAGQYFLEGRTYSKPYAHDHRTRHQSRLSSAVEALDGSLIPTPGVEVSVGEIDYIITPEEMRRSALEGPHGPTLTRLERFVIDLVPWDATPNFEFGLTGSVGLGLARNDGRAPHDWDLVISSGLNDRSNILAALQARCIDDPRVRVSEYGKGWLIRQWVEESLLCPFFRDLTPTVTELQNINPAMTSLEGVVVEAGNSAIVPIRLRVRDAKGQEVDAVVLGLRSRGDVRVGDLVRVDGHWCELSVNGSEPIGAIVSTADAPRLLLAEPWTGFYA